MIINCLCGNLSVNKGDVIVFWYNVFYAVIWLIIDYLFRLISDAFCNKLTTATLFACKDRKTKQCKV